MKNFTTFLFALSAIIGSTVSFSQSTEKEEIKQVKKNEVSQEVRMEEENGHKVLTILTTKNDKTTEEVFEGEAAEKKMAELQGTMKFKEEKQQVELKEVEGKKTLTITTIKEGKESIEVYTGLDAEKKMKEMGIQPAKMKVVEEEQVIEKL